MFNLKTAFNISTKSSFLKYLRHELCKKIKLYLRKYSMLIFYDILFMTVSQCTSFNSRIGVYKFQTFPLTKQSDQNTYQNKT